MPLERISPEQTHEKLQSDEDWIYLDVRTVEEFEAGHVPGARNAPVFERGPSGMTPNEEFVDVVAANFSKDAKIITACLRGGRSLKAAELLIEAGFSNVVDMRGGFDGEPGPGGGIAYPGWARRGLPVTVETEPGASYAELRDSGKE